MDGTSTRRRGAVIGALSTGAVVIVVILVLLALASIDPPGDRPLRTTSSAPRSTTSAIADKPRDPEAVVGDFLAEREGSENPADWITSEDYPPDALRNEIEGRVVFELEVTATGRPLRCRITSSSGSPSLDQATCRAVMRSARFAPQRDAKGEPIPFRVSRSVRWQIPE